MISIIKGKYHWIIKQLGHVEISLVASAKGGTVRRFMDRSILRLNNRLELVFLYLGCFLLAGFFVYLKHQADDSDVLMSYIKFMIEKRRAFVLGFSAFVLVFLYQLVTKARTEVRCRVLVGDTFRQIKLRYLVECLILLGISFLLSTVVHLLLGFEIVDSFYVLLALAAYVLLSAVFLGAR